MKRLMLCLAMLGLVSAWCAQGAGLIVVDESHWLPPQPPHPVPPLWPPRPAPPPVFRFAPLEVHELKVDTRITGQVAVTRVDQEFYNPNPNRLEGNFLFPVPKGAHLDKFSMEIDGKMAQAELLSANKARGIYEDIVRKLKDPALLEYSECEVFKVRIFPIEPHSRKRIQISYTQLLRADSGLVGYVLPLNTGKFSAVPMRNVSVKVELEADRSLKSIYSPSHNVEIKRHGPLRATVGYEATEVRPDTDFVLYFSPERDEIGMNVLTHRAAGEDGYFLLLAAPGVDSNPKNVVPRDIIFVLDTSGSMAGKKLEQAKKALQFCCENLNESDRFEVLRFSTEVEPLFDALLPATKSNRNRAADFIAQLKPMGGTAIDEALSRAFARGDVAQRETKDSQARPLLIIFLTDGRPTIGTTSEEAILKNLTKHNSEKTRVFCFGLGTDVNTHLLDKVSESTRAFSQYVLPEEDLEVKLSSFYTKIKEPVLADPELRIGGEIRATRLHPSRLPDLFRGEQVVMLGRYSGSGDAAIVIEGRVEGASRKFTYEGSFPLSNAEHDFLPRLWATRRVGYLLEEIRLHGENAELREEVTDLARKYGIVTPYTAYLIVEDEARQNVPTSQRSLLRMSDDSGARREAQSAWQGYQRDTAGDSAVFGSRYGLALKSATAAAPAASGSAIESRRALGLQPTPGTVAGVLSDKERLAQYSAQNRFVAGRNFFQNDRQWLDASVQTVAKSEPKRIQFASAEYFQLAREHPETLPWLALGQNVQFVLRERVYEIYE
jgi:Ca-activated chloride channel family protein